MTKLALITKQLQSHLIEAMTEANTIYFVVAFIQKSGVQLIISHLKEASRRGAEIKILVGDYLYITNPDALQLLIDELPEAEIRLFESKGRSFHPKAYLFRYETTCQTFIGSSNLSKSALTTGIEWNVHTELRIDAPFFERAVDQFLQLFFHEQTLSLHTLTLENYRSNYERANATYNLSTQVEADDFTVDFSPIISEEIITDYKLSPRPAQQLALEALQTMREEQYDKALVIMATGLGKTYLAAFFARSFKRVLFIAHREQLLHQAKQSFSNVFPTDEMSIFDGTHKEKDGRFVFASIFTLSAHYHLQQFDRDAFDLIIIDEFHHATATSYERVLNYFKPQFLLGITATPDRLDNQDVYALCDGNVAISIHFIDAIRQGWLSPFHYIGVRDPIDYTTIEWRASRYDETQLLSAQLREEYAETALREWQKYKQERTLAFCSSVAQALAMSEYFNDASYRTVALHGDSTIAERRTMIERLHLGELDAIFTVNLFNEGVDIPLVDTLLFLRPTESLAVFTQQIGRGLRLAEGKSHCVIIDLIGNYRKADLKLAVFSQDQTIPNSFVASDFHLPPDCHIEFDTGVIDLLQMLRTKRSPRKQRALDALRQLRLELGKTPTYLQFHLKANVDSKIVREQFKTYPQFLGYAQLLNEIERQTLTKFEQWFQTLTTTKMTKSYKLIVVLAMLQRGERNWYKPITLQEIAPFFHRYLMAKNYRWQTDLSDKQGEALQQYNEQKIVQLLKQMPIRAWTNSYTEAKWDGEHFSFSFQPTEEEQRILFNWTHQICEYRLHTYFERKSKINF